MTSKVMSSSGEIPFPLGKSIPLVSSSSEITHPGNGKQLQAKVFAQNQRHPSGGWKFVDEVELKKQRGVCWELVKSAGNSLIEGKELVNTSLPIALFEPRSFLEKLTDTWCYAPVYLSKAAAAVDPVERLKYVVAFTMSGLHLTSTLTKPFNPLLGETFEGHFYDGTKVFCEQTSHHPPISNWQVQDKDNRYHYYGYGVWSASCRGNIVKGYQKGTHTIEFHDGGTITWTLPEILVKGIFWGDRLTDFNGKILFTDEKNKICCEITFNPHALGFVRSIFSKQKEPSDYFVGQIFKTGTTESKSGKEKKQDADVICSFEGSWLTHLSFDNTVYWDIKMVPPGIVYEENPLPTDCRFREDLRYLKEGNTDKAKEYKSIVEERQRAEAKLRKEGKKEKSKKK
ncbi:oxysterol binding family protein [Heterostelium album PN500]|uniref:Oxysterol binding family protein n=1 Tax=Heterostelium pallidum (strain ATCC 26659 / Pp 5 / PN500) TaxID=670386 RepID=D3AXU4_HETP5|nr:oxysterol binding family protein [Heterostelium album PN500]EFA85771.1 oxysterol binding family protein [Heterostelium album PN500]|eukprot:XP_020437877.1 oxysterol binding family protein [Heterostelium album PN500]